MSAPRAQKRRAARVELAHSPIANTHLGLIPDNMPDKLKKLAFLVDMLCHIDRLRLAFQQCHCGLVCGATILLQVLFHGRDHLPPHDAFDQACDLRMFGLEQVRHVNDPP